MMMMMTTTTMIATRTNMEEVVLEFSDPEDSVRISEQEAAVHGDVEDLCHEVADQEDSMDLSTADHLHIFLAGRTLAPETSVVHRA